MDTQQVYERIRAHFTQPGNYLSTITSEDDETICVYRSPDGQRCAFGVLIDDELYHPSFENKTAKCLLERGSHAFEANPVDEGAMFALREALAYDAKTIDFVDRAQSEHDSVASASGDDINWTATAEDEFVRRLDRLAESVGLSVPEAA